MKITRKDLYFLLFAIAGIAFGFLALTEEPPAAPSVNGEEHCNFLLQEQKQECAETYSNYEDVKLKYWNINECIDSIHIPACR